MARAVAEHASGAATIVAMAAAVSDYRPAERCAAEDEEGGGGTARCRLVRTPDILAALGADKGGRFLIGFAAETEHVLENARGKRAAKNASTCWSPTT